MIPKLHIANTFFEWELETDSNIPLSEAFNQNPIYLQLQFLPILYADAMIVTDRPRLSLEIPKLFTFDDTLFPRDAEIESWGASQLIAKWAKRHGLTYHMPDWQIVKQINSKQFSFENSPKLPGSALLTDEAQAKEWLKSFEGKKVLKTCFGLSGKGHLFVEKGAPISSFLQKQWDKGLPVIGEPWVERVLDFSTQWQIDTEGKVHYLGATLCQNDERGQYRSNTVGEEKLVFDNHLSFLAQHREIAEPLLHTIAQLGFFGNIGIDAMIYNPEEPRLHPVVEINARKTMGWAALAFQKRHCPGKTICFRFAHGEQGYLPHQLSLKNGKTIHFKRNLTIYRK